jgi:hypothetical protein
MKTAQRKIKTSSGNYFNGQLTLDKPIKTKKAGEEKYHYMAAIPFRACIPSQGFKSPQRMETLKTLKNLLSIFSIFIVNVMIQFFL